MCGLAGYLQLSANKQSEADTQGFVTRMANALRHRGPDDAGTFVDASAGVAFGQQRLAIQDLSAAGHQPMVSACGRYVIALNGEIYNHLELRQKLQATWRGHSDTETLLAAIAAWGIERSLQKCIGMFALALWDRQTQALSLARDRFGEKPLYYGWVGASDSRAFAFASELKALREYPGFDNEISREALAQYLRFTYVPAPLSIYQGIYKLEPGCLLTLSSSAGSFSPGDVITVSPWWSFQDLVARSTHDPIQSEAQAISTLEGALSQAVAAQCISDVPLGAFLSGGVDSSTIAALMQAQSLAPIKTFTIGFDEAGFDEAPHARAVAAHLGTDHYEMRVSPQMAQDIIPRLPHMYDEPFADSSQIPTHLVSKAAREHVTVALSGDAGDELFGGYNRYVWGPRIWSRLSWMPFPVRHRLGRAIQTVPIAGWDALSGLAGVSRLGDKAYKLAACLGSVRSMDDLYSSLVSEWSDPATLVVRGDEESQSRPAVGLSDSSASLRTQEPPLGLSAAERMMFRDTLTYLPDDILCKVDRAAMAVGLETRVPFLDHRVVEMAWRLPMHMKIRGKTSKWALRQVLYRYVPKELIERPKAGFAVPIGEWLCGPLRDWAEGLLDPARLRAEGYLHPGPIQEAWREHLSGKRDHTPKLWAVLMFQAWLEHTSKPYAH